MDKGEVLTTIAADGERILALAGDLDTPVPTCPDWTLRNLLAHVGRVHRFALAHTAHGVTGPVDRSTIDQAPEDDEQLREYVATGLDALLTRFGEIEPDQPMWAWGSRQDGWFWMRRMVHELTVHRIDAELAVGDPTPIDQERAADGIDELCTEILGRRLGLDDREPPTGSLHLHRTDGGAGEWTLRVVDGSIQVGHGHEKGDAALRGAAQDLFLVMWRRRPVDAVEVFGDADVVSSWLELSP